jgi:hypothetical protein
MVATMGAQYCSWLLRFLLPSLWEAEVAISAAALLATVALLVVLDQTASSTSAAASPPSSAAEACGRDSRCRRQRRSRRAKRSNKAAPEPGLASEVRPYRSCAGCTACIDPHFPTQMTMLTWFPDQPPQIEIVADSSPSRGTTTAYVIKVRFVSISSSVHS